MVSAGTATVGVGLTRTLNVTGNPVHELAVGVTVITEDIGSIPVFVAVNVGISPELPEGSPMSVLLLVQV